MISGSTSELSLAIDAGLLAVVFALRLGVDHLDDPFAKADGGRVDLAEPLRQREPRDRVEEIDRVGAELLVRGHQAHVAVNAGRDLVEIARAEMDVPHDAVRLAADDDADLRVRLEPFHAVNHLHAGAFQVPGPFDIPRLVEAGLELDDRRDVFAPSGRPLQCGDDRAVAAGAVEGLLDRQHVRVVGRLFDQADDRLEALVRMDQQHVFAGDDVEHPRPEIDVGRNARRPRLVFEVVETVQVRDPHEAGQVERTGQAHRYRRPRR